MKTPTGIHKIESKIGDNLPFGTIFSKKENINCIANIIKSEKKYSNNQPVYMTSRIICLKGMEKENLNSYNRCIYIHGTNKEYLIGKPASHGCIRMKNDDVIELYDLISTINYINIKEKI